MVVMDGPESVTLRKDQPVSNCRREKKGRREGLEQEGPRRRSKGSRSRKGREGEAD